MLTYYLLNGLEWRGCEKVHNQGGLRWDGTLQTTSKKVGDGSASLCTL